MKNTPFKSTLSPAFIAITLALTTNIVAASSNKNAFDFNKADSVLSDNIYYQIGGGVGYMAPPTRANSLTAAEFGIGWKANLTCGNFDIKTTVKNQLNGLTEGFKDLYSNVIESATGAVASLPAMIIQRANPQLYDILSNGVYQGKIDFSQLKTSCEAMSKKLADTTLNGRWSEMADLEKFKEITASEPDANKAQKQRESAQGKDGVPWIGGQKRGGEGQNPIKLVEDVSKAGYNMLSNRNPTETENVTSGNCSGLLCQTWEKPVEMTEWLTHVIGEQTLITCQTDCGPKSKSQPGVGITPEIEKENIQTLVNLQAALNMETPSSAVLAELSSPSVPVTRGLIEALKDDPDVEVLSQRLSSEIAVSKTVGKLLLARRAILTGMKEPNVVNNNDAQTELKKILETIDSEIEQVRMEIDLQKSLTGNTALAILQSKEARQQRTGTFNVKNDDVDKRISNLAEGKADPSLDEAENLAIPRKNIQFSVPATSNSLSFQPTFDFSSSTGSASGSVGKYSSVEQISGTAMDQATGLLKNFEGFKSTAYKDVNAYRTGYGSDTVTRADGTIVRVTPTTTVTREDAERDLARRTQEFANKARGNVTTDAWNKLPANAQAALTSYAYNYGHVTKDVADAARAAANSGNMSILAEAVRKRQTNNNGINAKRRNQEADYILGK